MRNFEFKHRTSAPQAEDGRAELPGKTMVAYVINASISRINRYYIMQYDTVDKKHISFLSTKGRWSLPDIDGIRPNTDDDFYFNSRRNAVRQLMAAAKPEKIYFNKCFMNGDNLHED